MNYEEFHTKEREIISELCSGRSEEVEDACRRLTALRRSYCDNCRRRMPYESNTPDYRSGVGVGVVTPRQSVPQRENSTDILERQNTDLVDRIDRDKDSIPFEAQTKRSLTGDTHLGREE